MNACKLLVAYRMCQKFNWIRRSSVSIYSNKLRPLDLDKVNSYPLSSRYSKVNVADFARPLNGAASIKDLFDSFPHLLAASSLRTLVEQMQRAKNLGRPIIWGIGGHVIKTGLAPIIINLMQHGFVTAIASNGSVPIHDAEIAMIGSTSEDVDATLGSGAFGAAEETSKFINDAAQIAVKKSIGFGESLGLTLTQLQPKFAEYSLLCAAYDCRVPFTVHVAIGTDIVHFHPTADGAALGVATHTDFRLFSAIVKELDQGGVYLNVGSAVILPEIFLKAVTLVRNLGYSINDFTTANLDFIQSYRPLTNVIHRPVNGDTPTGRGIAITGHHEISIPLLAAFLLSSETSDA